MSGDLTPAMVTVLREAPDDWRLSHANRHTLEALERRGLIETGFRARYALDLYVRRTPLGRAFLAKDPA